MARRPKKQSLLETTLNGSWGFSATLAIFLLVLIYVVTPIITNSMLKPLVLSIKPIGLFLVVIFGIISLIKFILQKKSNNESNPRSVAAPIHSPPVVIFSDGIEADYLEFNVGNTATISIASRQGLLINSSKKYFDR